MNFRDPVSIPLPTTSHEFERMCLLIAREQYGPEYYRYARSGQGQHGIDIYSPYHRGRYLQCKLHKKPISDKTLIRELKKDLSNAKERFSDLKQFIFAVSVESRETVYEVCEELSEGEVRVIPWFWNHLQEDIARSKWLLRYCLKCEAGAQWISDDFVEKEEKKGEEEGWQPLQFYSSNLNVQWYGLLQNWDAPRQHYRSIREAIAKSFADTHSDMPVAAVVRGEGGSGKSVLLRRLALDLRTEYTIYWVDDNAADFLNNEWLYDIENHPTEKYLLVLEDWYRNFANPGDRATANRLLQKIRKKPNVRLLIGDRPAQYTYYPKTNDNIFDLNTDENATLVSFIVNIVPHWRDKFLEEEKVQLLKSGFFQVLFIYQYLDTSKPLPKAGNYFLEIIQSDYRHLANHDNSLYRGLAQTLYVLAHLYVDYGLHLSPEALVTLAESYSDSQRPLSHQRDIRAIFDDPVTRRYIDVVDVGVKRGTADTGFNRIQFLHDTLADQGWKYAPVDIRYVFGNPDTIAQLIDALRTRETAYDLARMLFFVLRAKPGMVTKAQAIACCDYLIFLGCESPFYVYVLFTEGLIEMSDRERLAYIPRLTGLGRLNSFFWSKVVIWIKKRMNDKDYRETLGSLVDAGTHCNSVLVGYFRALDEDELKQVSDDFLTAERLKERCYGPSLTVILKRLRYDEEIRAISRKYLKSPEPEKVFEIFTTCLHILSEEPVAKEAARKYLQSPESEKTHQSFTTCLHILSEEPVAKEPARKYLQSPNPDKVTEIFSTCLKILQDEKVAKVAATRILASPIEGSDHRLIYRALCIAAETEELDTHAEDMVRRILEQKPKHFSKTLLRQYNLYLQMMKVPLFRIKSWQSEVDGILQDKSKIYRNLFYSITRSHIEKPAPVADACLYYVRNWRSEFSRPKEHWMYFVRSLAHPSIVERSNVKEEMSQLCSQMLRAHNCPAKLESWLRFITEEDRFPLWNSAGDRELRSPLGPS
ncbi:MAG: hypothetical protein KAR42_13685 [candidate division Zixibacteria bacterium]|nr:hypothetical protein [candidate division Zixibacteria bacterium]